MGTQVVYELGSVNVIIQPLPEFKGAEERMREGELCLQTFDTAKGGGLITGALPDPSGEMAGFVISVDQVKVSCQKCISILMRLMESWPKEEILAGNRHG